MNVDSDSKSDEMTNYFFGHFIVFIDGFVLWLPMMEVQRTD